MSHPSSRDVVTSLFTRAYGAPADVVASAPGRVNLIGEHTDYNGGQVLPIAIACRTWVAVRAIPGSRSVALSREESQRGVWDANRPERSGNWWDYVAGVAAMLAPPGAPASAVEVAVASDVPTGAGLSSSAALEVASATALASLAGLTLSRREAALLGHEVETTFVGVASGIMDQFASALGEPASALHIRCDTTETTSVPFADRVLIFDTGVPRSLRGSAFNARRAECARALDLLRAHEPSLQHLAHATPEQVHDARLPPPLDRRARHVTEETQRVAAATRALLGGGTIPADLLYASHESLRSLYECSSAELDWFVSHASRTAGVRGARLTGAGWGGCAIAFGDSEALDDLARAAPTAYREVFDHSPRVWLSHADGGARLEPALD